VISVTTEPVPALQFPGVTVISATSGDEACDAWNLEVAG